MKKIHEEMGESQNPGLAKNLRDNLVQLILPPDNLLHAVSGQPQDQEVVWAAKTVPVGNECAVITRAYGKEQRRSCPGFVVVLVEPWAMANTCFP